MNTTSRIHPITPIRPDTDMDRALSLIADAFEFEVVERCPAPCQFCDEPLTNAA